MNHCISILKKLGGVLGVCLCIVLISLPAFSQGSAGRILGAITDQSGGAISGATVVITDTERGTTRNLTTDDGGEYNAPSLIPGTYRVHVEAKGFKAVDRQNVMLEVNGNVRVDIKLQPGEVTQTITITEELPLVETSNAQLGGTLQNTIIENLPLNGRNFENLLTLRPGVQIYVGGGGWTQSTNGIRPHDNVYLVEGVNSNDPWMAQSIMNAAMAGGDAGTILPVDAIQEFKTQVNPPAENGWKPGAVVSVGIKSGTNSYHGTAYAYGRSDAFDARNYFNPDVHSNPDCVTDPFQCTKSPLSLQQFGATFGGPIKKNKLFYFANFEDQRYSVGSPVEHKVPTPASLAAACMTAASSTVAGQQLTALSAQLAGFTFNPATLGTVAATGNCNLVSGQPKGGFQGVLPVSDTGFSNTILNSSNRIDSGLLKMDFHINDKNTISGMYFISPGDGTLVDNPGREVSQAWLTDQYARSQVGTVNWTYVPNSNLVNVARVGYSHYYQVFQSLDHSQDPANYSFNGSTYHMYTGQTNPAYFGFPRIRFNGFSNLQLGVQWPKTVGPDSVLQLADQVSYLHGNHTIKFGGEILVNQSTTNVQDHAKGPVQFGSLTKFFSGTPKANPNTGFLTGSLARQMSFNGYAAFVQDDWRIKPTVTVNLGLRYEITTVMKERNDLIGNFDPSSPTGLVQVGSGLTSPINGDHNNFSPRVGIAWDVRGDGKTVIRAGGSIIYEQLSLDAFNGVANFLGLRMTPTGANLYKSGDGVTFTPGTGSINVVSTDGLAAVTQNWGISCGNAACTTPGTPIYSQSAGCGTGVGGDPAPCGILAVDRNLRSPYVSTWTLGIQRAITNNMSLEVAYVGNHGTKLLGMANINEPAVGSGWGDKNVVGTPANLCLASAPTGYDNCAPDSNLERLNQPFTKSCPTTNGVGLGIGSGKCFPYLSYVDFISNHDKSNYNGLQVTLTQRTSHGLSFTAGYTYSHALDNNGDNEGNGLHTPIDSSNAGALYGNSDFDIRHRLTISVTYALPGKSGFGQMLEGWSLNSIVTLQSGSVWGVNDQGNDLSGTNEMSNPAGSIGEQWIFTGGSPSAFTPVHGWTDTNSGSGGVPFYDASDPACAAQALKLDNGAAIGMAQAALATTGCFRVGNAMLVPQPFGTFGTTGRNVFRDAGFKNLDLSLTKEFKFKERLTSQFRAEVFNVFNHPVFANPYGGPGGAAADPSAGAGYGFTGVTPDVQASNSVLGSGGARAIQLGLKLIF